MAQISSPRDVVALNDVTCRDNAECIAVGRTIEGGGVVLVTSERVHRWTAEWEGRSKGEMMGVACSSLVCHAVGFMGPHYRLAIMERAETLVSLSCRRTREEPGSKPGHTAEQEYWPGSPANRQDSALQLVGLLGTGTKAMAASMTSSFGLRMLAHGLSSLFPDQYDSFGIQGVTTWGAGGFAALDQNGQGVSVLAQTSSRRT